MQLPCSCSDTSFKACRAPRIIGTLQIFGGHKNAAKEAGLIQSLSPGQVPVGALPSPASP